MPIPYAFLYEIESAPPPEFQLSISISPSVIFVGKQVYFIAKVLKGSVNSVEWYVRKTANYDDPFTQLEDTQNILIGTDLISSYIFEEEGFYTVSLVAHASNGQVAHYRFSIVVNKKLKIPLEPVTIDIQIDSFIFSVGSIIPFKAIISGDTDSIATVSWDFGDGTVISGSLDDMLTVYHKYTKEGVYIVTLTVTDINDITQQKQIAIIVALEVIDIPKQIFHFEDNLYSMSYVFMPKKADILANSFKFNPKLNFGYLKIGNKFYINTQPFYFRNYITSEIDLERYPIYGLQVIPFRLRHRLLSSVSLFNMSDFKPAGTIVTDVQAGFFPLKVHFYAVIANDKNIVTHWDFGDGTVSNERNPIHTFTKSGTYKVTLDVSNQAGSTRLTTIIIVFGNMLKYTLNTLDYRFYYLIYREEDMVYIFNLDSGKLFKKFGGHGSDFGKFNKPTTLTISV